MSKLKTVEKTNEPIPEGIEVEIEGKTVYVNIINKGKDRKCKLWFKTAILEKYKDYRIVISIDHFSMKYHYAMIYDNKIDWMDGPHPYYVYEKLQKTNNSKK